MKSFNNLFLISVFILILTCSKLNEAAYFTGTGHYYEYFNTLVSKIIAEQSCSTRVVDGKKGYLAAITSKAEWDFVKTLLPSDDITQRPWIAGTSNGSGLYYIDGGPENGTIIFDFPNDRTYTYTPWKSFEPNMNGIDFCINVAYEFGIPVWDVDQCSLSKGFICEYGGLEEYTFTQIPPSTNTYSIIIGSPNSKQLPQTITLKSQNSETSLAYISESQANLAKYSFAGLPGLYTFQLESNGTIYYYTHNSPYVDVVYPSYYQNTNITLVGDYFGDSTQTLSIKYNSTIPCQNVTRLQPNIVVCKITDNLSTTLRLLPLVVELNGIINTFKTIPFYDTPTKKFYSGTISGISYANVMNRYAPLSTAAGNPGRIYYPIYDNEFIIRRFLPFVQPAPAGSLGWNVWIGALTVGGRFYDYLSPSNTISLYGNTQGYSGNPPFTLNIEVESPSIMSADPSSGYPSMTQYGYGSPNISIYSVINFVLNTTGGDVDITLNSTACGHYFSTYFVIKNDLPSTQASIKRKTFLDTTTLTLSISPSYGGSTQVNIVVDGYTIPTPISYSFNNPFITSVSPLLPDGGFITIDGFNFFNDVSLIKLYFGSQQVYDFKLSKNHTQIIVNMGPTGSGTYKIRLTLGPSQIPSNEYQIQVFKPSITSTSQVNDFIVLTGEYFDNDLSQVKVYIGSLKSDYIVPLSSTTNEITFNLPENAQNGMILVSVRGVNSTAIPFSINPNIQTLLPIPKVTGSNITITGRFMNPYNAYDGSLIQTSVKVTSKGNIELNCTQLTYQYPYQINCLMIPGSGLFTLAINWGIINTYYKSSSYNSPSIFYTDPALPFNSGGNTTIIGDQFVENVLNASIGGIPCEPMKFINTTAISCYFPANISVPLPQQKGLEVSVTVDGLNTKNDAFFYKIHKDCPTTSNGVCDGNGDCNFETGLCSCRLPFIPPLCNNKGVIGSTPVPDPNGGTIIVGQGFNFSVQIVYLRELDQTNNQVKLLAIKDIQWENKSPNSSKDKMILFGKFSNESVTINLEMTIYTESNNVIFAGETIDIPANSIKYIITVNNYTFDSKLNSLQLIYNSMTDSKTSSGCETQQTQANSNKDVNGTVSYLQMMAAGTMMTARFANRLYVDSSIRKSDVIVLESNDPLYKSLGSSEQEDKFNLMTAINIPYFENNTIIDPNFGSLVTTTNSQCKSENKWKIPVIVVCSVVGAAAIACLLMWIIKKKHFSISRSIKLRTLS